MSQREKSNGRNFSYRTLEGKNFCDHELMDCDFRHSSLSRADFSGSVMFNSDFTGANLVNAIISLNCDTFAGVRYDRHQAEYMIYLLTLADIPDDIKDKLLDVLGENKTTSLQKIFGRNGHT